MESKLPCSHESISAEVWVDIMSGELRDLKNKVFDFVVDAMNFKCICPDKSCDCDKQADAITDQILSLFDLSKIEVEEECPEYDSIEGILPVREYDDLNNNKHINCLNCHGTSKILRPCTYSDIQKGGILKVNE